MWSVIKLKKANEIICIPSNWIKEFNYARTYNNGLKATAKYVIFHSPNLTETPCFRGPIQESFIPNVPAIYVANINRFFGEYNIINIISCSMMNLKKYETIIYCRN